MTDRAASDVVIVGAGLAGLTTALLLHEAGKRVRVLEAASDPGGRIRSVFEHARGGDARGEYVADLGPTWIWTPYQPVAGRWLDRLGLRVFDQFDEGPGVYEAQAGAPPVALQMPGQDGSRRVVGGPQAMVDRLLAALPAGVVRVRTRVAAIDARADGVQVVTAGPEPAVFTARRVVVAIPPRLADATLEWRPGLPGALAAALRATPTWMAPHAKAIVRYAHPFWRDRGLSGRLVSRAGPLVEAHDHCGPDGTPAALFGFVGWPAALRARRGAGALERAVESQLDRCLGPDAPRPLAIHVHDWARSDLTAAPADLDGPMEHPSTGPAVLREPHLDGRVRFATSETARRSPGLIEGALDAAEGAAAAILEEG